MSRSKGGDIILVNLYIGTNGTVRYVRVSLLKGFT